MTIKKEKLALERPVRIHLRQEAENMISVNLFPLNHGESQDKELDSTLSRLTSKRKDKVLIVSEMPFNDLCSPGMEFAPYFRKQNEKLVSCMKKYESLGRATIFYGDNYFYLFLGGKFGTIHDELSKSFFATEFPGGSELCTCLKLVCLAALKYTYDKRDQYILESGIGTARGGKFHEVLFVTGMGHANAIAKALSRGKEIGIRLLDDGELEQMKSRLCFTDGELDDRVTEFHKKLAASAIEKISTGLFDLIRDGMAKPKDRKFPKMILETKIFDIIAAEVLANTGN